MGVQYDCFEGKVVAVVGGALGLGRACSLMFARQKAKVVAADLNPEAGLALQEEVSREGGWLRYVETDATRLESIASFASFAVSQGELAVATNCVGGFRGSTDILELRPEEWEAGLRLNLTSVFFACQQLAKAMVGQGKGGSLVNISSLVSHSAPRVAPASYPAGKAGVEAVTRCFAAALGPEGIRVNAVAPGTTMSERIRELYTPAALAALGKQTARGRLAETEEIASAVLFLASDVAVHITGAVLHVNGGQLWVA